MAKKRGHGEGTIYKRSDGRWAAQVTIGRDPTSGGLRRRTFYGKTRQEVAAKLRTAKNDQDKGISIEPSNTTVGEWLDLWYGKYLRPHVRPTTADSYDTQIRCHLKPMLGIIPLRKLTTSHIQEALNQSLQSGRVDGQGGLSCKSVRYLRTILYGALKQAEAEGIIPRNPVGAVRLAKRQTRQVTSLTSEQVDALLTRSEHHRLYAAFVLAVGSGLRRGELLGLRWQDVNLERGTLQVVRSLSRVSAEGGGTKLVYQEPKTDNSKRTVPLPVSVVRALRAHRSRQAAEKLAAMGHACHENLVFTTEEGNPLDPTGFGRLFKRILGVDGMPLHALRHTYATRLLELGEHPKVVQELLGHSSIQTTLDTYSQVMPGLKERAVERLEGLFAHAGPGVACRHIKVGQ